MGHVGTAGKDVDRAQVAALAAAIAKALADEGLPMLAACEQDCGHKAAFAIRLPNGRDWAFRVPIENLRLESVRAMVEAYL
jgi:hypothetical protein